jgi:hypothetical protein
MKVTRKALNFFLNWAFLNSYVKTQPVEDLINGQTNCVYTVYCSLPYKEYIFIMKSFWLCFLFFYELCGTDLSRDNTNYWKIHRKNPNL